MQNVIEKIEEAENLVRYIESCFDKEEASLASIRWFIVADEATILIKNASEKEISSVLV